MAAMERNFHRPLLADCCRILPNDEKIVKGADFPD